jgi:hypothetical protein
MDACKTASWLPREICIFLSLRFNAHKKCVTTKVLVVPQIYRKLYIRTLQLEKGNILTFLIRIHTNTHTQF